ncbi:MarR family winged helix-turn-helix transcriptional regulator [Deinococcus cellulosilyticus]|uniref:MarR family transcriptional regulator n=1 Tax=Deinococcus cellulosilyticus (strain DSM 18568 / NBRC 106333 / KACC 11606 / 5516J-15) TaxID=1223518 RepID=A0A511MZB6_DEIC1|nr:MarR family transcriptional regulator [Deinococcus cellulosilyticus]GEM45497.1 MarR family transcriptional regulator [Deinococcus cellulosilyticus NBRC 106333 = KACC 11606]
MEARDAISLISRIRGKVNQFIVSEMAEAGMEGLGTSHGDILYALFRSTRLTMAEVAQRIGKDKSTVTSLVDKLARLGYLVRERDTGDSRVVYLELTQKGKDLEPVFEEISRDVLERFYLNISDQERENLLGILKKIHSNF